MIRSNNKFLVLGLALSVMASGCGPGLKPKASKDLAGATPGSNLKTDQNPVAAPAVVDFASSIQSVSLSSDGKGIVSVSVNYSDVDAKDANGAKAAAKITALTLTGNLNAEKKAELKDAAHPEVTGSVTCVDNACNPATITLTKTEADAAKVVKGAVSLVSKVLENGKFHVSVNPSLPYDKCDRLNHKVSKDLGNGRNDDSSVRENRVVVTDILNDKEVAKSLVTISMVSLGSVVRMETSVGENASVSVSRKETGKDAESNTYPASVSVTAQKNHVSVIFKDSNLRMGSLTIGDDL